MNIMSAAATFNFQERFGSCRVMRQASEKKLLILIGSIPEIVEPQIEAAMEASCREQLNDAVRASSSRYAAFYQTAEHFDLLRKGMAYELYEIIDWIPSARNIQKLQIMSKAAVLTRLLALAAAGPWTLQGA